MGLLTGGHLSISVFKVNTQLGLQGMVTAAEKHRYPADPTEPSNGWGSTSDDPLFAGPEGVRIKKYKGFKLAAAKNHVDTPILALRYYYDLYDPKLVRRFTSDADWRLISVRHSFDVLLLDEGEPNQITALVTTRKADEVDNYVRQALNELVEDETPPGTITSSSVTEELEPDFFLWLLYMHHKNRRIAPMVKLSGISDMNSVYVGKRANMSRGVDMSSEVSLSLVGRNRAAFGPARVALYHYAEPEGYFELQVYPDGGFHIYTGSKYDDQELKKLPPAQSRPRMVQDIWQTILPPIRAAHKADSAWRDSERAQFVKWSKEELKKFL
ncbi:hypothetical protein FHR72_003634 [Mycolicibacterium iranicum]|uniref:Uncharacterized protein n=1 Tax=Mycolicibacterium iranicum TaxID=912594 RepID=A0A839Q7E7_MYCIR|nr:hypothetical protein [Mycolicibacterium iranicum]MBB2992138.1 hypothetical protein [Mycolicibacterium iranicum]